MGRSSIGNRVLSVAAVPTSFGGLLATGAAPVIDVEFLAPVGFDQLFQAGHVAGFDELEDPHVVAIGFIERRGSENGAKSVLRR